MRRWIAIVAALACALVVSVPAEAHGPAALGWARTGTLVPSGTEVTVRGTLRLYHIDDFSDDVGADGYAVETSAGLVPLDIRGAAPEALNGARVQVRGTWHDGVIRVGVARDATSLAKLGTPPRRRSAAVLGADGQSVHLADGAPLAAASKNVAVILFGFSDDASQPYTPSAATQVTFTNGNAVANYFEEESRGAVTVTGQVFGWYQIAASKATCDPFTWATQARAAATRGRRRSQHVHQLRLCVPEGEQLRLVGPRRDARQGQLEQRLVRPAGRGPRAGSQLRGPSRQQPELHVRFHPGLDLPDLLIVGVRRSVLGDGQRKHRPRQRDPPWPVRLAAHERDPDSRAGWPVRARIRARWPGRDRPAPPDRSPRRDLALPRRPLGPRAVLRQLQPGRRRGERSDRADLPGRAEPGLWPEPDPAGGHHAEHELVRETRPWRSARP